MPKVLRGKCIVIGDSTVGKSSLIKCLQTDGNQFAKNYSMVDIDSTLGVDISVKTLQIDDTQDIVELYMYDSSGKELYSEFVQNFWNNPGLVAVVFDVTDKGSFVSCAKWLERVKARKAGAELILPGVLIGNKTDLSQRREVSEEEATTFAKLNELNYFECSVKEQINVVEPFKYLAEQFKTLYETKNEQLQSLILSQ